MKSTPVHVEDHASVASSDVSATKKQTQKHQVQSLLKMHSESKARHYCRRCFCSIGFCAASFLILFALFISVLVWVLTFVSGFVATMSAIDSVKTLVRKQAIFALEDKLSEPSEFLSSQRNAFKSFQVKLEPNGESLENFHRNIMYTVIEYEKSLGVGIYYGTQTDIFGGAFWDSDKENLSTNFAYYNGTYYSQAYDRNLTEIAPEVTTSPFLFKPTVRPWYQQAVQRRAPGISDVYLFITTGTDFDSPGITYTYPFINDTTGEVEVVFAVDYNLFEMAGLLRDIEVGKSGSIFMVERNGLLLGSSRNISFTTVDGDRLSASQSPDKSQRKAAQLIEENIGFENVEDGHTIEYNGGRDVLEVYTITPRLKSSQQLLLDQPWVIVLNYPLFNDYTQPILWYNLGAVGLTIIALLVSCVIAIAILLCVFVIPLNRLVKDMGIIQTMDLQNIKKRRFAPIFEIRELQINFYRTLDFLKLYRSFLPSYLLQDTTAEEKDFSEGASDRGSKMSGSILSHKTGLYSHHSDLNSKAFQKLRKFEIGLEHGEGAALCISINFYDEVASMNETHFVEQHSRIVSVVNSAFKLHQGMLDRFSEQKLIGNFFESRRAVNAAVHIRKKLNHLIGQFSNQYPHHVDFSIGLSIGEMTVGVMGSDELRSKRVFGKAVKLAQKCSKVGKDWPCKLIIDRHSMNRVDKKKWIYRPITNVPELPQGPVYEIVGSSSIRSNEWLYEKHDQNRNDAIAIYRKAFEQIEKENSEKAIELLNSFLEVYEEDALALKHLKMLEAEDNE